MKTSKRFASWVLVGALALASLTACHSDTDTVASASAQMSQSIPDNVAVANPASNSTLVTGEPAAGSNAQTVPLALAENKDPHAVVDDSDAAGSAATGSAAETAVTVSIVLDGDAIAVDGAGVAVEGSTATITAAGSYTISGALADGQIVVDTEDDEAVQLILAGADVRSSTSAPLTVANAEVVEIVLAGGTENHLADGATYVYANPEEDEPNAALFSKADLTIAGSGSLTVEGNYNDGIASKDGLVIAGGVITVSAVDDGIRGKDYLVVEGGSLSVDAGGDGLKSDEAEDAAKGYIAVQGGDIAVSAGGDAISAETDVLISGGQFTLTAGGGSGASIDADSSAKGIKAGVDVTIDGGVFTVDAADDALHSNDSLTVNGGELSLATGDDALHAETTLTINDGAIEVLRSYEGIESASITINGGDIAVSSSDDGINVASGVDGSGMGPGMARGGRPGQQTFTYTGNNYLTINGGVIAVEAGGDGIDVNGAIEMTGGLVVVNGPTANMNGALDYDGGFKISGGYLAAAGSAGMAQAPDASSSQYSLLLNFPSALPAGSVVHVQNGDGETLMTFAPLKTFQSIAFSSPDLQPGDKVVIYFGGSASGASLDGLTLEGSYTPGDEIASLTVSNVVTTVGNRSR